MIWDLDVEPEPVDCEKPQSFENNFVHHMAIGETIVGTLWTSFAGICIEKLLDELLKVLGKVTRSSDLILLVVVFSMELIKRNLHRKNLKIHLNLLQVPHHLQQC